MRKLGIAAVVFVVILLAFALIAPHLIDVNRYHGVIQAQLESRLGRQVSLGNMGLRVFPPSFSVENAVIAEDRNFDRGAQFASVETLFVSVKFWPLLQRKIELKSLELVRPRIELLRNSQGIWNFASLGKTTEQSVATQSKAGGPPPPADQKAPTSTPGTQLALDSLVIKDGQLGVTDLQAHTPRAVYDHIDVKLTDFAPDSPFTIQAAVHFAGSGQQSATLDGHGGPFRTADLATAPFDGKVRLDHVAISDVRQFLKSDALKDVDGQLSGEADVRNGPGKIASEGLLRLEKGRVQGMDVAQLLTLDYAITSDLNDKTYHIQKGNIRFGSIPASVTGTIKSQATPVEIDAHLVTTNAPIEELARLASKFGLAFGPDMNVAGEVSANLQAHGGMDRPVLNGQLSARDLSIKSPKIPGEVKVPLVDLALTPDTIRSNEFTASSGSTNVACAFTIGQYATPKPTLNATLRVPNGRIGELIHIAQAMGMSAAQGVSGDGALVLNAQAQGPAKDLSAMAFSGSGKIQNAWIKSEAMTKPLQIRNSDIRFSQNSAALENLSAAVGQTNASGSVLVKGFGAPQIQFTLSADKVNVAELRQIFATAPGPVKSAREQSFWQVIEKANAEKTNGQAMPTQRSGGAGPSPITKMTGTGAINVGTIQYDNLLLTNVHSKVALDHGLITMAPLTADLYGGGESGNVVVDMRPVQPVYTVNLATTKVDANKLLSSVSSVKDVLYGLLNANINARFSSTSAEDITRNLNGKLGINMVNGKLMNVDLLHELASVGRFLGNFSAAQKGFTNIAQLTGTFDVQNGVAQTNDLKAVIDGGTTSASGTINAADQTLNLRVTAVLNKALSQQVGGSQVGGFMSTALANNQGELVLPVLVTGRMQHPQVSPDVQQMAQMKLQNLLPTTKGVGSLLGGKNAKGGVQGILDSLGVNKSQGDQGAKGKTQPQQGQNPLGDVLNQVFGKGKKSQPTPTPPK
ncbi:MAG TPA: AsmA family protein [Candidatus Angelobacter sp.]|nr:AsmA family protein [Candidatus Angelobacter sp.]